MTPKESWAQLRTLKSELEHRGLTADAADLWHRYLQHDAPGLFDPVNLEKAVRNFQETIDIHDDMMQQAKVHKASQAKKGLPLHLLPADVAARVPTFRYRSEGSFGGSDRYEMGKALRMLRTSDMTDRQREDIDKFQRAIVDAYRKVYTEKAPPPELEEWKSNIPELLFNQWVTQLPDELYSKVFHGDNEPFLLWLFHLLNKEFGKNAPGVVRYTKAPRAYDFAFTEELETFEIPRTETQIMDGSWRKVRISSERDDLEFLERQQASRNASGGYGLSEEDPREFVKKAHAQRAKEQAEDAALMAWRERGKTMTPEELRAHRGEIEPLGFYGARGRKLYAELVRDAELNRERAEAERLQAEENAEIRNSLLHGDEEGFVIVRMVETGWITKRDDTGRPVVRYGDTVKIPIMTPINVYGRVVQWPQGFSSLRTASGDLLTGYVLNNVAVRPDPFYPPETPIEVWKAGAPYATVQRLVIQGEPLYGWPVPHTYDREWKVIRANGTTVPKNSRKHQEFADIAYLNKVDRK